MLSSSATPAPSRNTTRSWSLYTVPRISSRPLPCTVTGRPSKIEGRCTTIGALVTPPAWPGPARDASQTSAPCSAFCPVPGLFGSRHATTAVALSARGPAGRRFRRGAGRSCAGCRSSSRPGLGQQGSRSRRRKRSRPRARRAGPNEHPGCRPRRATGGRLAHPGPTGTSPGRRLSHHRGRAAPLSVADHVVGDGTRALLGWAIAVTGGGAERAGDRSLERGGLRWLPRSCCTSRPRGAGRAPAIALNWLRSASRPSWTPPRMANVGR